MNLSTGASQASPENQKLTLEADDNDVSMEGDFEETWDDYRIDTEAK